MSTTSRRSRSTSSSENLPEETRIYPYLGTYYYPINSEEAAVRRSQSPPGAYDGDRTPRRSPTRCSRPASCRPTAWCRPRPASYGDPYVPDWANLAARRAPSDGAGAAGGSGLRARQSAQVDAVLQHQREPQADRRRGAGDVEGDRRTGRAGQPRGQGPLRRAEAEQFRCCARRLGGRLQRSAEFPLPAGDPHRAEQLRSVQQSRVRRAHDGAGARSAIRPSAWT